VSEPFIGQIIMFSGNFAPRGWALCDGQLLSISNNTALFSILGTTYGGDGRTNFALPDLRGRVPVHAGSGPGLPPARLGDKAGAAQHALTAQQMPSHTHSLHCQTGDGTSDEPANHFPAKTGGGESIYADSQNGAMNANAIQNAGGGQAFSIMQPYQVVNFIIALVGLYPSRN